jgi:hypothetical protein
MNALVNTEGKPQSTSVQQPPISFYIRSFDMFLPTKFRLSIGLLLAVCSAPSWAFQPLITDDTGTQGTGGNQIELAFSDDRTDQDGVVNNVRVLPLTFTRGLTETLDLSLSANHTRLSSSVPGTAVDSGSGNPSVGLKWRFYEDEASKTSLALKAELGLPISQEQEWLGLGSGRGSYAVTGILMQETSFGAILLNLAGTQVRYSDSGANPDVSLLRASVAPVWQINDEWKLALDIGSITETAADQKKHTTFIEIGAVYSPGKDIDIAFGFISRKDESSASNTGITGGLTWRFK